MLFIVRESGTEEVALHGKKLTTVNELAWKNSIA